MQLINMGFSVMIRYLIIVGLVIFRFYGQTQPLTLNDVVWRNNTAQFQLTDIGDLLLWCDVTTATNSGGYGTPTNGMVINALNRDLSPRNHTVQCTDGTLYISTGGGGNGSFPYLTLTNSNFGQGSCVGTSQNVTNGTTFTVVSVIKPTGLGDSGFLFGDTTFADGVGPIGAIRINGNGGLNQVNNNSFGVFNGGGTLESNDTTPGTNWMVLTMVFNGASSSIWSNTTILASGVVGTTYALNRDNFCWSSISYGGVNYSTMLFERGLIYGHGLTSNEVYQVNRKCMTDFGFP